MIGVLMLPLFTRVSILINFKINQGFIAEILCIDREEPITTCQGKCYLTEQLKKTGEPEEKPSPTTEQRIELVYYHANSFLDFDPLTDRYENNSNTVFQQDLYISSFITDIFRPPKPSLV